MTSAGIRASKFAGEATSHAATFSPLAYTSTGWKGNSGCFVQPAILIFNRSGPDPRAMGNAIFAEVPSVHVCALPGLPQPEPRYGCTPPPCPNASTLPTTFAGAAGDGVTAACGFDSGVLESRSQLADSIAPVQITKKKAFDLITVHVRQNNELRKSASGWQMKGQRAYARNRPCAVTPDLSLCWVMTDGSYAGIAG